MTCCAVAGAEDCNSAGHAEVGCPSAQHRAGRPAQPGAHISSPTLHTAGTPSSAAADTVQADAAAGVLTRSSSPAVDSAAAPCSAALPALQTIQSTSPAHSQASLASAGVSTAAAAAPAAGHAGCSCPSTGLEQQPLVAPAQHGAPATAVGDATQSPGVAGSSIPPTRPLSPFAAMAGEPIGADTGSTGPQAREC